MRNSQFKLIIGLLIFSFVTLNARPKKMHERMATIKKVKLLEFLDINSETSDKLLILMNKYDSKSYELREKIRTEGRAFYKDLDDLSEEDVKQKNDKIIDYQMQMAEIHSNKLKDARDILSEKEFAKYQLFEMKFAEEVRKHLIRRRGSKKNK